VCWFCVLVLCAAPFHAWVRGDATGYIIRFIYAPPTCLPCPAMLYSLYPQGRIQSVRESGCAARHCFRVAPRCW
jgi:hypothetical protein